MMGSTLLKPFVGKVILEWIVSCFRPIRIELHLLTFEFELGQVTDTENSRKKTDPVSDS